MLLAEEETNRCVRRLVHRIYWHYRHSIHVRLSSRLRSSSVLRSVRIDWSPISVHRFSGMGRHNGEEWLAMASVLDTRPLRWSLPVLVGEDEHWSRLFVEEGREEHVPNWQWYLAVEWHDVEHNHSSTDGIISKNDWRSTEHRHGTFVQRRNSRHEDRLERLLDRRWIRWGSDRSLRELLRVEHDFDDRVSRSEDNQSVERISDQLSY